MSIPIEIFNKIMLYNSHPVADIFNDAYGDDFEYVQESCNGLEPDSFYEFWSMQMNRKKEDIRQWKIYKSKYIYYDNK